MQRKVLLVGPYHDSKASGLTRFLINLKNMELENVRFYICEDSIINCGKRSFFLIFKRLYALITILKSGNFEIIQIHCNSVGPSFFYKYIQLIICKISGKTIFVRYGNAETIKFIEKNYFLRPLFNIYFGLHDLLIVQSNSSVEPFINFIPRKKIFVLSNFIVNNQQPSYKIINDKKRVLFFGGGNKYGDDYRKGCYDILKLLTNNESLLDKFNFICLKSSKRFFLDCKKSGMHERLVFLPLIDYKNIFKLYKSIDILLLPSYNEGFPNSIIECMSMGIAIISTTVGSIPDIVSNGINGYLVRPGDLVDIKDKLEFFYDSNNLCSVKKRNIRFFQEKYSINSIKPKLYKLYNQSFQSL